MLKEETELQHEKLHILIIGNDQWYSQHSSFFKKLQDKYSLEYIKDIHEASQRLWHNSYDMLLIEQKFCKENTIKLSKLSYARSKPSIILCNNLFMELIYKIWKRFSKFCRICSTMRKLMFIYYNINKQLIRNIDNIANTHYQYRDSITLEIKKYFN